MAENQRPLAYRRLSTNTTNAVAISAQPGRLFSLSVSNLHASNKAYVKLYNKATAPTLASDTPVFTFPIAAATGSTIYLNIPDGVFFSTGIAMAITGALADNDTTAVGANDVIVNAVYR